MAQQFREVKRKANVGDRIRIVKAQCNIDYGNGDEFTVKRLSGDSGGIDFIDNAGDENTASISEYVVLEPVEATSIDRLTADIAQMALRLAAVEKELAELKRQPTFTSYKPADLARTLDDAIRRDIAEATKPRSRDEIVAQAKRDIEALKVTHHPTLLRYYTFRYYECDAEFIVNREKRTVACLLRKQKYGGNGRVVSRGIAKCDPDDCFNSAIGRAISLRRALDLEVPEEYVKCPQPTEVHPGDLVWNVMKTRKLRVVSTDNPLGDDGLDLNYVRRQGRLPIDDSRENTPKAEVAQ